MRQASLTTLALATLLLLFVSQDLIAASPTVEVKRLDGNTSLGTLVAIARDNVTVTTGEGAEIHSKRDLFSVGFPDTYLDDDALPPENPRHITFTDDSLIQATDLTVANGRATIAIQHSDPIVASTRTIQSIRFFSPVPELAEQWRSIEAAEDINGDVLVIRKSQVVEDQDGIEQEIIGLDSLEGVIYEVDDSGVGFEFDGTRVSVPRHKVEGLIYFRRDSARSLQPTSQLILVDGSKCNMRYCEVDGELLKGITFAGVRVSVPLNTVAKIDYSIGNLVFLGDLEPASFEWNPTVPTFNTKSSATSWYKLHVDTGFFDAPLTVGSQSFERGLALRSETKLVYRLTQDFTRFAAIAGIDDRHRAIGNVTLTILGNGKELLSDSIAGDKRLDIDIDIAGIRRLEILVGFGEDGTDSGDYLNFGNARLLK